MKNVRFLAVALLTIAAIAAHASTPTPEAMAASYARQALALQYAQQLAAVGIILTHAESEEQVAGAQAEAAELLQRANDDGVLARTTRIANAINPEVAIRLLPSREAANLGWWVRGYFREFDYRLHAFKLGFMVGGCTGAAVTAYCFLR